MMIYQQLFGRVSTNAYVRKIAKAVMNEMISEFNSEKHNLCVIFDLQ